MCVARFSLEIIVDTLHGSAGAFAEQVLATPSEAAPALATAGEVPTRPALSDLRPAIGIRLLDLATCVLEAPEGEVYRQAHSSRVNFGDPRIALS